jgi:peptide deformylase
MTIRTWPDSVLQRPVDKSRISEDDAAAHYELMREALKTRMDGIALAANQIGIDADMFIYIDNRGDILGVLNPVIRFVSPTTSILKEGCLSLDPTQVYPVRRHHVINVNYTLFPSMKLIKGDLDGLEAQIFQHEMDHLIGVTLLNQPEA